MMSEKFATTEGVREGRGPGPLLFIVFTDYLIRQSRQRIKPILVGYRKLQKVELAECAFADDLV
ncbi:unnamed protein product [Acanthoscelides obtectus]|uniref:Reverse transcriptase n=1 Tax=Acanthoscelides obtectus TaxID=200917 RepID=A0A9P0L5V0_ACAOB|nr:unnamed protein product [Acanthoscelides obtectus]CAK1635133.1 hypothetical protein AOBTE_LOCUS9083 [Acanthoscelides obtectus]